MLFKRLTHNVINNNINSVKSVSNGYINKIKMSQKYFSFLLVSKLQHGNDVTVIAIKLATSPLANKLHYNKLHTGNSVAETSAVTTGSFLQTFYIQVGGKKTHFNRQTPEVITSPRRREATEHVGVHQARLQGPVRGACQPVAPGS